MNAPQSTDLVTQVWCGVCDTPMRESSPGSFQHDGECSGPPPKPRMAYARRAFILHFDREPISDPFDARWISGYVAALEDLSNEALASLGIL